MARPLKQGLDYFPLDTHWNDKVKFLRAEFGVEGIGILVSLWQKIYADHGYYTPWDDDVALLFASEIGAGFPVVSEVVRCCLRRDIFHKGMYANHGVLTSAGIQRRYLASTKRRAASLKPEISLVKCAEIVSAPINPVYVCNNPVNDCSNATNQIKPNQNEINKNKDLPSVGLTDDRPAGGEKPDLDSVMEYAGLIGASGTAAVSFFETMEGCGWIARDGNPVRNWRAVFRKWSERERFETVRQQEEQDAEQTAYANARAAYENARKEADTWQLTGLSSTDGSPA